VIKIDLIRESSFFIPTPQLKELIILDYIEDNSDVTQKELAKVANAAPSMINVYIEELEEKGYMKREYISAKVVNYLITPKGIQRKNFLLITYMRELLDLYHMAKRNVETFLKGLEAKGYKDLLLYGAGEVAETMIGVIRDKEETKVNVLAIIDDDVEKQGKEMMGYRVIAVDEIGEYEHDAIIVTSYTFEKDIIKKLDNIGYESGKVVKFFGAIEDNNI